MNLNWKVGFLVMQVVAVAFPTGLLGKWRPDNLSNILIHVTDQSIMGTMDEKHSVWMEIKDQKTHEIFLDNLQVKKKPVDWFNVVKYRDHIRIFQKIQQNGIVFQYTFLDEKSLEIRSKIGEENHRFILLKILEEEKNDF